ncbi:hypothetical protein [Actinoallomurus vinaceus]|uniref:hypothetical protein n=1 Tax=Actinoallomurus vinaceus TaxID=1080074 RepID=UPI0031E6F676
MRLHPDGTVCTHKVKPSGKPREGEDCPGTAKFRADCDSCSWTEEGYLKVILERPVSAHRAAHRTGKVPTRDGGGQ